MSPGGSLDLVAQIEAFVADRDRLVLPVPWDLRGLRRSRDDELHLVAGLAAEATPRSLSRRNGNKRGVAWLMTARAGSAGGADAADADVDARAGDQAAACRPCGAAERARQVFRLATTPPPASPSDSGEELRTLHLVDVTETTVRGSAGQAAP